MLVCVHGKWVKYGKWRFEGGGGGGDRPPLSFAPHGKFGAAASVVSIFFLVFWTGVFVHCVVVSVE